MTYPANDPDSGTARDMLASFRDRIVSLEERKREIADDIKDVYAEAKSNGFDRKALRHVVKRAMETAEERQAREETEEIAELYLGTLGMLGGTPLGEAARRRMAKSPETPPKAPESDDDEPAPTTTAPETLTAEQIAGAHAAGREAQQAGLRIIDNPFTAGDPRRAAWDEGWCASAGSDGMDLPAAWRRPAKPRKSGLPPEQPPETASPPAAPGETADETDDEPANP